MIDPIFFSRVVETDWKRELGQSYMICVKEKKDEKRGALCCVLCYSNSSGGGGLGFYFFILLAFFFQHVKKLLNVWNFVNIKVAKSKLDHLGFYCKLDFFDRTIRKIQKLKSKLSTNRWDTLNITYNCEFINKRLIKRALMYILLASYYTFSSYYTYCLEFVS